MTFLTTQTTPHILIVDDNAYNLEVLSRRLEKRGYKVTCVENGTDALTLINDGALDLVLLDIMMPGISGIEVLTETRRTFSKMALPIIMVTSKGESEDVVQALNQGANDYIMKPIDFPVALARIQAQISQKQEVHRYAKTKITYSLNHGDEFGEYTLREKIGQGGMGAVYKAYDPSLDRLVALKVILPGNELSKAQIERFTREARAIAKIRHPNIITVYDIGETPQYYFTMDFIEGENLSQRIKSGSLDQDTCIDVCAKMASALDAVHAKGIVHRDLKPSNIMLDRFCEPHLMDFGLAKLESEEEQITRTGDLLGTPEYMAPEQVDPTFGDVNHRSDIYALGSILYEMLTDKAPFIGTPIRVLWQKLNEAPQRPSLIKPGVSPELDSICLKAMARDPEDRFLTALDLKEALEALL